MIDEKYHEQIIEALRATADNAYRLALASGAGSYAKFKDPEIGDLVYEYSTAMRRYPAHRAVGFLDRIAHEDVYPDWDEAEEGEPCPTEKVWYIRLLSGDIMRWTNCEFHKIPTEIWTTC